MTRAEGFSSDCASAFTAAGDGADAEDPQAEVLAVGEAAGQSRLRAGDGDDHWRRHGGDAVAVDYRTSVATAEKVAAESRGPTVGADCRLRSAGWVRSAVTTTLNPVWVWDATV